MEYHSHAEQITNWTIFGFQILKVNYFWGDIAWSSTSNKHVVFIGILSQTKVSNDAIVVTLFSQKDVFGFEIAMHYVALMHGLESFQNAF